MSIVDIYKEAYVSKEAGITGIAKAGALLGTNAGIYAALGIPVGLGVLGALAASKITDPTKTDLDNFEKEAYIAELRARLDRVKRLPKAEYSAAESTLRV